MKKYTYYFSYKGKHGSDEAGSVSFVASSIIVANRMFERTYTREDEDVCRSACAPSKSYMAGIEINVNSIVESTTLS
jgi:hypothetical protein